MRDFSMFRATFWTGETGRALRKLGRDYQLLAAYLFTGPTANMIGLYHLPIALIADHLGWSKEGACKALRRVCETGFCFYDEVREEIWLPEMAAQQVGTHLDRKDKRVVGIAREWESMRKSSFYKGFYERYKDAFHLPEPTPERRPIEGAYKPHRSQDTDTGQDIGQGQGQDHGHDHHPPNPPPGGGGIAALIERWNRIPGVAQAKEATDKRKNAYRQRAQHADWLQKLDEALRKVAASSFCRGSGDKGWVADLDWFLRPDTVTKILEGKYDDRNGQHQSNKFGGLKAFAAKEAQHDTHRVYEDHGLPFDGNREADGGQ